MFTSINLKLVVSQCKENFLHWLITFGIAYRETRSTHNKTKSTQVGSQVCEIDLIALESETMSMTIRVFAQSVSCLGLVFVPSCHFYYFYIHNIIKACLFLHCLLWNHCWFYVLLLLSDTLYIIYNLFGKNTSCPVYEIRVQCTHWIYNQFVIFGGNNKVVDNWSIDFTFCGWNFVNKHKLHSTQKRRANSQYYLCLRKNQLTPVYIVRENSGMPKRFYTPKLNPSSPPPPLPHFNISRFELLYLFYVDMQNLLT